MLKVEIDTRAGSDDITPATFVFPGGEVHVALPDFDSEHVRLARIHALLKTSDDVMRLFMLTDSLRRRIGQAFEALAPRSPAHHDIAAGRGLRAPVVGRLE